MTEFRMPSLGADMAAGILNEWKISPGDRVSPGDIVAVVETDKGAIEVEMFTGGTVKRLLVEPGARVPVGTALAEIDEGEAAPSGPEAASPPPPQAPIVEAPAAHPIELSADDGAAWVRSSPAARSLARARGVELGRVRGSGRHGAVVRADVERATGGRPPPQAEPAPSMRRAIATAMERSHREIPQYHLTHDLDLRRALSWLAEHNAPRRIPDRVLPAALLLRAVATVLVRFPEFNGHWIDGQFQPAKGVDLAIAVALRAGGLVTPSVRDAQSLSLDALMAALADVVTRARSGRLRSSELAGGTVTVTNLGDLGVDSVFGIIYPPQVALFGFGRIAERPVAVEGMLAVHPVVRVTLTADHRASDGHRGGLLLAAMDRLLQEPPAP